MLDDDSENVLLIPVDSRILRSRLLEVVCECQLGENQPHHGPTEGLTDAYVRPPAKPSDSLSMVVIVRRLGVGLRVGKPSLGTPGFGLVKVFRIEA